MNPSFSITIAIASILCVAMAILSARKTLQISLKEVRLITHHRRGDFGIDTFSRVLVVPSWLFAVFFVLAVVLMSFVGSRWTFLPG